MVSGSPERERAARHEARARNYLQKATLLLEDYADIDSAAALMYEAAKQCINAIANQRGTNPGKTGGKVNVLRALVEQRPDYPYLMRNWRLVTRLHAHADQGFMTEADFSEAWEWANMFVADMLSIYSDGE